MHSDRSESLGEEVRGEGGAAGEGLLSYGSHSNQNNTACWSSGVMGCARVWVASSVDLPQSAPSSVFNVEGEAGRRIRYGALSVVFVGLRRGFVAELAAFAHPAGPQGQCWIGLTQLEPGTTLWRLGTKK